MTGPRYRPAHVLGGSKRRGRRASQLRDAAVLVNLCWDWQDQIHRVETPSVRRRRRLAELDAATRPDRP